VEVSNTEHNALTVSFKFILKSFAENLNTFCFIPQSSNVNNSTVNCNSKCA